jgi:hypothetical protein
MLGSAQCSKNISDGPIKLLLLGKKKKKKPVGAPPSVIKEVRKRRKNVSSLEMI